MKLDCVELDGCTSWTQQPAYTPQLTAEHLLLFFTRDK